MSFKPIYKLREGVDEKEVCYAALCCETCPAALVVLEQHMDKQAKLAMESGHYFLNNIYGTQLLCMNPNAVHLLDKFWRFIEHDLDWHALSMNPKALRLIDKHWDGSHLDLCCLVMNPNADWLIRKRWKQIVPYKNIFETWGESLSDESYLRLKQMSNYDRFKKSRELNILSNFPKSAPNVVRDFELDTAAMRDQCRPFAEELAAYVFHPSRVNFDDMLDEE